MLDIVANRHEQSEFERSESEVRYYCRHMTAVFARAQNAIVWDEDGRAHIDFLSACGSLNYGHNHPHIKEAVMGYLAVDGILNALDLHTEAKRGFLRAFRELILEPRGLSYRVQFTGPTGTNAVEAALKLARKVTGRTAVVAFSNAFHGMSAGAQAAGGRQIKGVPPGGEVIRLAYENYNGAGRAELERFEAMARDPSGGIASPAAFIVEAVQGEGGLNTASAAWLQQLAAMARRLGALLILDEVQAGCGRTGSFFSFEGLGITPDLVCLAKSIGGIGLPMALLLVKPEHDQWAPGEHNGTFRGNNLAFVAATAALELWQQPEFLQSLKRSNAIVQNWIAEIVTELGPAVAWAKGRGLMAGVAFADPALAQEIAAEAVRMGLLIETAGPHDEVIKLLPPLVIEEVALIEGLARLRSAVRQVVHQAHKKSAA
jgi:diaminobutyrate-2-oxoglutarate transaminase